MKKVHAVSSDVKKQINCNYVYNKNSCNVIRGRCLHDNFFCCDMFTVRVKTQT